MRRSGAMRKASGAYGEHALQISEPLARENKIKRNKAGGASAQRHRPAHRRHPAAAFT